MIIATLPVIVSRSPFVVGARNFLITGSLHLYREISPPVRFNNEHGMEADGHASKESNHRISNAGI